ncbi:MAG: hypothetical protein NTX42_05710 [Methanothrix sp.]|nr:hypothetical protein [Methanothrix sp.]
MMLLASLRLCARFRVQAKARSPYEGWTILALSTILASTDIQVALISLGADCAVGVVGKTCICVPTRLIYSLKSWIDK